MYHLYNFWAPKERNEPSLGYFDISEVDGFFDPRAFDRSSVKNIGDGSFAETEEDTERMFISADDKERMMEAAGVRDSLIIELLWCTGFRRSTLANATLEGLDRENDTLEAYSPKDDDPKKRPLSTKALDLLSVYLEMGVRDGIYRGAGTDALLVGPNEPLGGQGINAAVKQAAEDAGIQRTVAEDVNGAERKEITAHTVRHGYAMELLEDGASIHEVRKAMGHTDIETTQIYVDMTEDEVVDRLKEVGPAAE